MIILGFRGAIFSRPFLSQPLLHPLRRFQLDFVVGVLDVNGSVGVVDDRKWREIEIDEFGTVV